MMVYNLKKSNIINSSTAIHYSDNYNETWVLELNKKYFFSINNVIELPPENTYEDENCIFFELNNKIFIFSKKNGNLLLKLILYDDFSEINITYNGYIIVTDTTILLISKYNYAIIKFEIYPDTIKNYEIKKKKILISTYSEEVFEYKI